MDHPVKDIPAVLRKVTRGTPQEQYDALRAYFEPTAALSGPLVRVPPISDISIRHLGILNSRRAIYLLCRLHKLLVRTQNLTIKSAVYDQRTATLTLQTTHTIAPILLPFHKPTIPATLVLRLAQRSLDAHGRMLPAGEDPPPATGVRTRLYVSELEALLQPADVLRALVPVLGAPFAAAVRMCVTLWLVMLGSVLVPLAEFLPEAVVRNGDAVLANKNH